MTTSETKSKTALKVLRKRADAPTDAVWRRNLTTMQERACELAADIIVNGGKESDVDRFLFALLCHERNRQIQGRNSEYTPEKHAEDWRAEWYRKLARHWPEERPRPSDPMPRTVVEMAQARIREQARSYFDEFLREVENLSEVYLLRDILFDWQSDGRELANSFARELGLARTYVSVPWKHQARVREFARFLEDEEAGAK